MKRCPRCGQVKPLSQFPKQADRPQGVSSHCRACKNEARRRRYNANITHERKRSINYYHDNREAILERRNPQRAYKRWKAAHPDGLWIQFLKSRHGLSPEQWSAMQDEQQGLCYLCARPLPADRAKIAVDHDHSHCPPGKSCHACRRGLACAGCNAAIGILLDDPAMLRRVAASLERAKTLAAARIMAAPAQGSLFVTGNAALAEPGA